MIYPALLALALALLTGCAHKQPEPVRYTQIPEQKKLERCEMQSVNNTSADPRDVITSQRLDIKCLQTSVKKYEENVDALNALRNKQ